MSTSIIAFVIVLGVLIFFHELGHFLFARLFGVGVEKFSLGFGPKIFGKKIGMTDYLVSAIPLGGYVKMVGEEPDSELSAEEIPFSFTHKHMFKKILIVAAGPIFNLILTIVIFFGLFCFYGMLVLKPVVGNVSEGTPAYKAGLQKDDLIEAINGMPVDSWEKMAELVSTCNGEELEVHLRREDSALVVKIRPELQITKNLFGEDVERYLIGISSSGKVFQRPLSIGQAAVESVARTWKISKLTVLSIVKMIQGTISAKDNLGGPIQIAQMAGDFYKEGAPNFLSFIAFLSVTLAIINFLPIPVLDGGHILFFIIEAVTGRPVNLKFREIFQQIGIAVLVMLMIFAFYNDIMRIVVQK
ncbi:MAG: RIP metalloprotease RseP [Deltaproteobacteria bacterium]|nr:RIP metalloprotease RseP [Deltaproteobacteria bacterium]